MEPSASAATTSRGGASSASGTETAICSSGPATRPMPAARSRPRANITRDMAVMSAKPATPGAYSRNAWVSWVT